MARPSPGALMTEAAFIRGKLRRLGVPERDAEDLTMDVLAAAWIAVCEGRYSPDPSAPPRGALRGWLRGIAWNLASHYRDKASVRREVFTADGATPGQGEPDEGRPMDQRLADREELAAALGALDRMRPEDAEVIRAWLAAVLDDAASVPALAAELGRPFSTVYKILYRFRLRLPRSLLEDAAKLPPIGVKRRGKK